MGAAEERSHQQPACRSGRLPDGFWKGTNTATALSPRTPIILEFNTPVRREEIFLFSSLGRGTIKKRRDITLLEFLQC